MVLTYALARAVSTAIANLYATGSITVPGWRKPEGAVVELGGQRWKVTDLAPGKKPREDA